MNTNVNFIKASGQRSDQGVLNSEIWVDVYIPLSSVDIFINDGVNANNEKLYKAKISDEYLHSIKSMQIIKLLCVVSETQLKALNQ